MFKVKVPISKKELEILKEHRVGLCANCQSFVWCDISPSGEGEDCDSCLAKKSVYGMTKAVDIYLVDLKDEGDYVFV